MAPLLFIAIAGLIWEVVRITPWPESAGLLLVAQLLAAVAMLFGPILAMAYISTALTRRAVTKVGTSWCQENQFSLVRVEMHKNHFAVVYKDGERKGRAKFRVKFILTTWQVREVIWL